MKWLTIATLALGVIGCGFDPPNGHLLCATSGKVCPDGMECVEAHCWRKGTAPADLSGTSEPTLDFAVPPKDNGEPCTMDGECKSAACSLENICCDKPCKGPCEACDSTGTCKNIVGTSVAPHPTCDGMSTCVGTCDGTQPACTYPPSGTICGGACDGTCNGTGTCSSSGGVCPNGYACGVGSCKTSCTGNGDCQTHFHCDTGMCKRDPETDCLDGVDNNGDGLADCADPMCTAGYTCVPIPQAATPLGVHITGGACPTDYTVQMNPFHSGLSNGSCSGCTCQTKWSATVSGYGANMTCSGAATKSYNHVGKDQDAFCDTPAGTFQSVGLTVFGPSACVTGGTVVYSGATWATNDTFCVARTSNTCGDANHVCAAKPMGAAGMCDAVPSGGACPTGYANNDGVTYYTNYSGGGCNACGCSNGSNTPVIIGAAYTGAGCTGTIKSAVGNGDCNPGASTAYASMRLSYTFGAIVDNCSTSATAKAVSGTGGTTFCCQN